MKHLLLLFFAFILSACGSDIVSGSQGVGQQCFFPSDCSAGLSCYGRVCAPIRDGLSPQPADMGTTNPDMNVDTSPDVNPPPPIDMFDCIEGETRCLDERYVLVCQNGRFQDLPCPDDSLCSDDDCILNLNNNPCEDEDGDGFGFGCNAGPDCDDRNARVNPGRGESCETPYDDNCNGLSNEDCGSECCPADCGVNGTFCTNSCQCVNVDPDECLYQEQPCSEENAFNNGFICTSLGGGSQLRCYGVCDSFAADPDATCPEQGNVCNINEDGPGICLTGCDTDAGCAAAGNGCLKYGDGSKEGICTPFNPRNNVGDRCDPDAFFDCEENSYCVDADGNGRAVCVESCRPFANGLGGPSDCSNGHCLPLSDKIGFCAEDNGSRQGDRCAPQNTTCGEDAVGCYQNRCQRVCRLNLMGVNDCAPDEFCEDFGGQNDLGVCLEF